MNGTAQTLNYMIAGFGVIFGTLLIYIASLALRFHRLQQEIAIFSELAED